MQIKSAAAKSRRAPFVCLLLPPGGPGWGGGIAHQRGPGHGPHAAGHRSDVGRLGLHRGEVHIAAEPALAVPVHGHVDDHGPLLHHVRRDKAHPAHGGHQDVRLPGDGRQSWRLGVADRHGAVLLEQQHSHRLAHDVAAAQHHTPFAPDGDGVFPQHLHDAGGGAGQEHRISDHQAAHVIGVEAVHVLIPGDGVQHRLLVQMPGQRKLAQDAVHLRVAVQRLDQVQQRLLCGVLRQGVLKAQKAALGAVLFLPGHIDPGGGVVPYQDHRKARPPVQGLRRLRRLCLDLGRQRLAVNACCHRPLPFPRFGSPAAGGVPAPPARQGRSLPLPPGKRPPLPSPRRGGLLPPPLTPTHTPPEAV